MSVIGQRLRELRKGKGLSLERAARKMDISTNALAMYERGERVPSTERLRVLAEFYGVSVDYLFGRTNVPTSVPIPDAIPIGNTRKIPLVGVIRAGEPILAVQNIEDWLEVPEERVRGGNYFYLRVKGDSMEPLIREGSYVLVREQPDVASGEVAVVMVGNEEATIKRVYKANRTVVLKAENPKYPPIIAGSGEVQIVGRVMEVTFQI